MANRGLLLSYIDIKGTRGFEIGALMSPFLQRPAADVMLVDRLSTEDLRSKYALDSNVDVDRIAPVDVVLEGESLFGSMARHMGAGFDYAIASHVIEHVPDLVTWLDDAANLLRPGGRLILVIPDKRYTFDLLRSASALADAIDAYVRRTARPSPRQVFDFHALAAEVSKEAAWAGTLDHSAAKRYLSLDAALNVTVTSYRDQAYVDSHCWVFTPHSFLTLCSDLADLRLLQWRLVFLHPTQPGEEDFGVILERAASVPEGGSSESFRSWLERVA